MNYGVITACLNAEKTIKRTITSVFEQKLLPAEYIFVDGGSTDHTLEIIDEAIMHADKKFPEMKCKILNQTIKSGITGAWNIGLRELITDVVFILNSDDWYEPDTAKKILDHFSNDPDLDIVLGSGRYLTEVDDSNPEICHPRPFFVFPFAMTVIHPSTFVKRNVYERLGHFDERIKVAADYEFIYRCYKTGVKFRKDNHVIVNVLRGGFAEKNSELARQEVRTIAKKYCMVKIFPELAFVARLIFKN